MSAVIAVHLAFAMVALVLGAAILARRKGTPVHKRLGRLWVAVMLVVAGTSFWVRELDAAGGMSWIHLLSVWTLFSLAMALWGIKSGRVRTHRGFMLGTFAGLVGAGAFALTPGRLIGDFLARLWAN